MTTQEFNKAVMAFVFAYRAEDKRADSVHMDNAYDEWLEENLDKFEDDDSERDFAQWKNSEGVKPRDCDDVEKVEAMWAEYSGQRKDGADEEGRWVTTKNNHKVHINEEGVPDKGNSKVIESMADKTAGSGISGPDKEAKIKQLESELEGAKGLMAKSKIKTQIEMLKADWQGTKEEWLAHKKQKQEEEYKKSRERQVRGKAEKEAKAQRERIQLEHELRTQPKEKVAQYKIIQENNPMLDDYHVGIRKPSDIKTWDEVLTEDDGDSFAWGDFSKADAEKAQKTGKITVYSSYPIRQGVFVSTSRIQAQQYAGGEGGKVYSKKIPLSKVAWINGDEGQFADTLRKDGNGRGRRDAGKGRWITTENGHKVHLNEEGEPDKGNPHVVNAMKGGDPDDFDPFTELMKGAEEGEAGGATKNEAPKARRAVSGNNIVGTYDGDGDIKSVMRAQGFDGLPQVVSDEEFDRAVKESGVVAKRAYSASSQEVLDAYQDALYNGDWYVECEGEALFGKGMYTVTDYTGKGTEEVETEVNGYARRHAATDPYYVIEDMTLAPDAKIADFKDIGEKWFGKFNSKSIDFDKGMVADGIREIEEEYGPDAALYARSMCGDPAVSERESHKAESAIGEDMAGMIDDITNDLLDRYEGLLKERSMKLRARFGDINAYAAALGYDAVRVGSDKEHATYTVILNRTKTIIKDSRNRKDEEDVGTITFRPGKNGKMEAIQDGKVVGWVMTNDVQETKADSEGEFDLQLESKLDRLEDIRRRNRADASFEDEPVDELIDDFGLGDDDEDWITVNGTHILLNEEGKAVNGGDLEGEDFSHAKSEPTIEHRPTPEVGKRKSTDFLPVHSYRDTKAFKDVAAAHKESWKKADELWAKREELEEAIKAESRPKPKDEWDEEDEYQSLIGKKPRVYTEKGEKLKEELSKVEEDWHKQRRVRDEMSEKLDKMKEQEHKRQVAAYKPNKLKDAKQDEYEGFTLDKTSNSFGDEYLENGKGRIVEMSPREYLERCAYEIFHNGTMESTMGAVDEKTTDKYAEQMKNGVKFDLPYLNYKEMGQEGRHRAVAAYKAGIETIPVLIIGKPHRNDGMGGRKTYKARKHSPLTRNGLLSKLWLCGNRYISEKLLDSVCGNVTIIVARDIVHGDEEPAEWITTENGAHIPLDENGKALGGAGGWAKGKDFSEAKTEEKKKKPRRRSKIRHVHKKPIYVVQNGKASVITTGGKGTTQTKGPAPSGKPEEAKGTEKPTEAKAEPEAKAPETKAEPESKAPKSEEPKKEGPKPEDSTPEKKEEKDPYRKGTIDDPSPYGENVPCTGMKNARCEHEHEKHWEEVGAKDQKEYDGKAINLIGQPVGGDIDGYLRKPRPGTNDKPVVVRFNRKTGEIAIGIPGGYYLTYYKAKYNAETGESNLERANKYFDFLKETEGK